MSSLKRKAKTDDELLVPRKRKIENVEEIASPARSAAALSSSLHCVHPSVRKTGIKEIKSPRMDGFCGFRAAACNSMGESNYPIVKKKMLEALDKYEDRYIAQLRIKEEELMTARAMITCGIDRPLEEVKRADKRAEEIGDFPEQRESKAALAELIRNEPALDKHRREVGANTDFWFQDFHCGQILADALSTPVCIYPSNFQEKPFTFLPLDLPKKQTVKPAPIHLQHTPNHWISLRFGATHSGLPAVFYDVHWNKKDNMAMYLNYWNRWGQFPKCVNGRIEDFFAYLLHTDKPQEATIILQSDDEESDEEIIDLC